MRGESGEKSARSWMFEVACRKTPSRLKCSDTEPGHHYGVTRNAEGGAKCFLGEEFPIVDEGLDKAAPGFGVGPEFPVLIVEVAMEQDGGAIVQRMRQWEITVDPLKTVIGER